MKRCINFTDARAIEKLDALSNGSKSQYVQGLILNDIQNKNYNSNELMALIRSILDGGPKEEAISIEAMQSIFDAE